jgi:hypothetical protein
MKRIMMLLMVALVMFGVSGQAMASFNDGDLIRVVYQGSGAGTEYITDLGNFSQATGQLTAPITSNNPLTGQDAFSLTSVGASSWSNVQVAYFIMDLAGNGGTGAAWTSGSPTTGGQVNLGTFNSFQGASALTYNSWQQNAGSGNSLTESQSSPVAYWQWLNNAQSGAADIGGMAGFLKTPQSSAEANLGNLATAGYVDQVLYYYGANPMTATQGTAVATIRTFLGGTASTEMLAAVPIPAAAYLFGSGLLGMFGLRRKMTAKDPELG